MARADRAADKSTRVQYNQCKREINYTVRAIDSSSALWLKHVRKALSL